MPALPSARDLHMSPSEGPLKLTDSELLQRTAGGDREAFSRFAERHQAAVYRHACYLAERREDAEDLLQETFLAALRAAGQFRGDASARTWLFTIARNAWLRRARPQAAAGGEEMDLESLAASAGWGSQNPESLAMLAQDRQRLERALARLGEGEREVIILRDLEGLSGEETAAVLGISLAAMKSRLHRGRIELAARLRGGAVSGVRT